LGQGPRRVPIDLRAVDCEASAAKPLKGAEVKMEFNHAANDSPRSGGSKRMTPVVWGAIVVAIVAVIIWLAVKA
jgi:hypothetical protein